MCAKYCLIAWRADWMHLVSGFKVYTGVIPNCTRLFLAFAILSKSISINLKKSSAEPSCKTLYPSSEASWPADWMTLREPSGPNSRHPHSVRSSLLLASELMTILRTYSYDRLRLPVNLAIDAGRHVHAHRPPPLIWFEFRKFVLPRLPRNFVLFFLNCRYRIKNGGLKWFIWKTGMAEVTTCTWVSPIWLCKGNCAGIFGPSWMCYEFMCFGLEIRWAMWIDVFFFKWPVWFFWGICFYILF